MGINKKYLIIKQEKTLIIMQIDVSKKCKVNCMHTQCAINHIANRCVKKCKVDGHRM